MEENNWNAYGLANEIESAKKTIESSRANYTVCKERLSDSIKNYGGISKLEDKSYEIASKLKQTEDNLKDSLGRWSLLDKEVNLNGPWSKENLAELKNLEAMLGGNSSRFFENQIYARLNRKGDVLIKEKQKGNGFASSILTPAYGVAGAVGGMIIGGMCEGIYHAIVSGPKNVNLDDLPLVVGAALGAVGSASFPYFTLKRWGSRSNPLSEGAKKIEEKTKLISEVVKNEK